jgi:predicted CoA-binding protein
MDSEQLKPTLILGASTNPGRASYQAALRLKSAGHPFFPVGLKKGELFGEPILDIREKPIPGPIHTLTLYLGPQNQPEYYEYILALKPSRVIFNPGTENSYLVKLLKESGIDYEFACTLVMLSLDQY